MSTQTSANESPRWYKQFITEPMTLRPHRSRSVSEQWEQSSVSVFHSGLDNNVSSSHRSRAGPVVIPATAPRTYSGTRQRKSLGSNSSVVRTPLVVQDQLFTQDSGQELDHYLGPELRPKLLANSHRRTYSGPIPLASRSGEASTSLPRIFSDHNSSDRLSGTKRDSNISRRRTSARPVSPNFNLDHHENPAHFSHERSRKMNHLMGITRGYARGRLFIRSDSAAEWILTQCSINVRKGSLVSEGRSGSPEKVIVENLQGCRVQTLLDPEFDSAVLLLRPLDTGAFNYLRPEDPSQGDRWYAAFLCWQPVHPLRTLGGRESLVPIGAPTMASPPEDHSLVKSRARRDAAIIKVSKALYLDAPNTGSSTDSGSATSFQDLSRKLHTTVALPWVRMSCTVRDNGELRLYTLANMSTIATLRLPDLSRSAVQRLDRSVFGITHCIAVWPGNSQKRKSSKVPQPIYIAFESKVLFEVWFVLLRSFTAPEIYGSGWVQSINLLSSMSPGQASDSDARNGLYRVEKSVHVHIAEARMANRISSEVTADEVDDQSISGKTYVQILVDDRVRARSCVKPASSNPFWYESLEVIDIMPDTAQIIIELRGQTQSVVTGEWPLSDDPEMHNVDHLVGKSGIDISIGTPNKDLETWVSLYSDEGLCTSEVLIKCRVNVDIVLMDREYHLLSNLLHRDVSSLPNMIARKIPSELSRLSECLLNIYQASGQAVEWLKSLAEEEIEGVHKGDSIQSRFEAPQDADSSDVAISRAILVREQNSAAVAEANLLFRGNTLLSKALDYHMKRMGKDYLDNTIGDKIRAIAAADPDCEVDPNRLKTGADLQQNWERLVALTGQLWTLIADSASRCPPELRSIFRHIRACIDDHYGERLRNVRYSSVSGFLFLRFFCPAILNPRLFGILRENPTVDAQRTFTLIAKSLQVLANSSYFGIKEPWMEPMNQFLSAHKHEFRTFIDNVCAIPPEQETTPLSPSYGVPLAMLTRLPPTSREGFPSLPHLIDHAQQYAILVKLWHDNFNETSLRSLEPELLRFHQICAALYKQAQRCVAQREGGTGREYQLAEK